MANRQQGFGRDLAIAGRTLTIYRAHNASANGGCGRVVTFQQGSVQQMRHHQVAKNRPFCHFFRIPKKF
jgi:hypothetical protein